MNNKIPLHSLRAQHAQKAYQYYVNRIKNDSEYAEQLKKELVARWDAMHPNSTHGREQFIRTINNTKPYRLRGVNKDTAIRNGRPIEYSRLGIIAVSVFTLSHWRLTVAVVNYLSVPDIL